ncbi:MAG TPA: DinB family protein, partial [Gemmatimonadales bacterium]|nr:DinB family protein [Gemmatimonadales bacterium]
MISLPAIRELFNYNYWARDRQLEACAPLTPEQFARPMGSSFSSVRDTLAHLMGAEWIWLQRWQGDPKHSLPGTAAAPPAEMWKRWSEQFPSVAALGDRWRTVESDLRKFLGNLNEERLAQP